jgi:hypothetical protein
MKARLLALAALMLWGASAFAQEDIDPPFSRYFTLEIGTGMAPLHTLINKGYLRLDSELADNGQTALSDGTWCPALSLSAAWHTSLRWEMVLTGGISWNHSKMIQYGTFGIDPRGRPRYDLQDPHDIGWKDTQPAGALFFQARRFWNPTQKVKLYSAAGVGLYTDGFDVYPVPSLTPIAVRFGTGHLKFFIENTYSPAATVFDIGLGWTF